MIRCISTTAKTLEKHARLDGTAVVPHTDAKLHRQVQTLSVLENACSLMVREWSINLYAGDFVPEARKHLPYRDGGLHRRLQGHL